MSLKLIDLILEMDLLSQLDVAVLFLFMGISFLIFFFKYMSLMSKFKQLNIALKFTKDTMSIKDLSSKAELLNNNFASSIIAKCLKEFKFLSTAYQMQNSSLTDQDWHLLEDSFCQIVDQEVQKESYGLWILSTIAAISPLLGLFGTVWGLIDSFLVVSDQASADLSSVSGGIAEALITTLFGVIAAIIALVMYNYLVSTIDILESKMFKLLERSNLIIKLAIVKKRSTDVDSMDNHVDSSVNSANNINRIREGQL